MNQQEQSTQPESEPQLQQPQTDGASAELQESGGRKTKIRIAVLGFVLFLVFVIGLFWLATTPEQTVGLTLSFVAGLSMIFLPCTLPMAFVIVPMTMGRSPKKGLLMAVFFGLGLTLTLSFYGVFIAALGKILGLTKATQAMLMVGGGAAFVFGLAEIGLLKFKLPSYSGKFPDFIQKQGDYIKTFLLGLFLGNAGVGCPNPAFYVLLGYIAQVGDLFNGWFLGFVHGAGRAVPLIFLAILGILGINATGGIAKKKVVVEKYMGWMLIIIGAFILTFGLFGHDWFVASGMHTTWEQIISNVGGEQFGEVVLKHEHKLVDVPQFIEYGNMFFLALIALTMFAYVFKSKPTRKTIIVLLVMFGSVFAFVGASTGWTFRTGTDIHLGHGGHGSGGADIVIPEGLDGAFVQDDGTVKTAAGDNAGGAHVMPDGTIMLGSGEVVPGAHVMPDGTVMVMQMVSTDVISSLPKRGPSDRVDELPYVMKDGVKEFRLTVDEFQWEYEPGRYIHAWGYNEQIPGPTIRVSEGDEVRVVVKNNLPNEGTSVHWHGQHLGEGNWTSDGVPGLTQEAIQPGEEFVYNFDALSTGTRWYHSHGKSHITVAQQVDMGLSGVFVTEPNIPNVDFDREYVLLLDEWDILPGGVNPAVGHVHGAATPGAVPEFNTFTINGQIFPYIDPIKVKEGEKALIRIVNGGTSAFHPMHTHGHDFELVALDGNPVPRSSIQERNVYTIHPGETADFLLTANNPGNWLFHCHHAHHAAAGMIMLVEYEGFEGPTTDDLRKMVAEAIDIRGIHEMPDGTIMLGNGTVLEGAHKMSDGKVMLGNGKMLEGVNLNQSGAESGGGHGHDPGTPDDHAH
jgi:cytochrome c-type biogenesis protein